MLSDYIFAFLDRQVGKNKNLLIIHYLHFKKKQEFFTP